jgi:hypothetical protein
MPVTGITFLVAIPFTLMAFSLFKCLRTREVQLGFGGVLREEESPLLFWLAIGLQCLTLSMAFNHLRGVRCSSEPTHELTRYRLLSEIEL